MRKKKEKKVVEKKPKQVSELVHVRIDYNESFESKKNLFEIQASLLKIMKAMRNYKELRDQELNLKMKLSRMVRIIDLNLKKIKKENPAVQFHQHHQHKRVETHVEFTPVIDGVSKNKNSDLENQLLEIQEQIRMLESRK